MSDSLLYEYLVPPYCSTPNKLFSDRPIGGDQFLCEPGMSVENLGIFRYFHLPFNQIDEITTLELLTTSLKYFSLNMMCNFAVRKYTHRVKYNSHVSEVEPTRIVVNYQLI